MEAASAQSGPLAEVWTRIDAGEMDDAVSLLRNLLKQQPADGHLHALIGVCKAQQGQMDEAIKSLETAVILSPGDPVVELKLAGALLQAGRTEQASWRAQRVLEADPDNEDAKGLLAHIRTNPAPAVSAPAPAVAAPPVARLVETPAAVPPPPAAQAAGVVPVPPSAAVALPFPAPAVAQPAAQAYPFHAPTPVAAEPPSLGLRLLRGLGWGLLYSQVWTVFAMVVVLFVSLLTTKVALAIIAFLVLGFMNLAFHGGMGMLIGAVAALMNADEDTGGWIGMSVGFLILLIGVMYGFLFFWSVFFYIGLGRWVGRSVAAHIQKPVNA
jgi:hypothetical protein